MFSKLPKKDLLHMRQEVKGRLQHIRDLKTEIKHLRRFVNMTSRPWCLLVIPTTRSKNWTDLAQFSSFKQARNWLFREDHGNIRNKEYCIINILDLAYFSKGELAACNGLGWDSLRVMKAAKGLVK